MIRYGVLPVDHDFNASVDPFELDKAYWKTFWYAPKMNRPSNPSIGVEPVPLPGPHL